MKPFIYFPTGKQMWVDLAAHLHHSKIATPVIWIGDKRHEEFAQKFFTNCTVMNFLASNKGELPPEESVQSTQPGELIPPHLVAQIKQQTMSMMARQDLFGAYGFIDREVFFYKILRYCHSMVAARSPEFLLAAEAPHSPAQFIIFKLCEFFKIPTFFFQSSTLAPVIFFKSSIDGDIIDADCDPSDLQLRTEIEANISGYCKKHQSETTSYADVEPEYMKAQRANLSAKEEDLSAPLFDRAPDGNSHYYFGLNKTYGEHPVHRQIEEHLYTSRRRFLRESYHKLAQRIDPENFKKPFVLFPLHYEPEKTTNPDGGEFYNQADTLLALRHLLPEDVTLIAKEHLSTFSLQNGYLGRSPFFYDFVSELPNTVLASCSTNILSLIDRSQFVAVITGTVGLEAILRGKKTLCFGNPWFATLPNVVRYTPEFNYERFVTAEVEGDVSSAILEVHRKGILSTINPSNDRYFKKIYARETIDSDMTALTNLIKREVCPSLGGRSEPSANNDRTDGEDQQSQGSTARIVLDSSPQFDLI